MSKLLNCYSILGDFCVYFSEKWYKSRRARFRKVDKIVNIL